MLALAARCFVSGRRRRALERYGKCEAYTRLACVFENRRERRLLAEAGVRIPQPAAFFPRTVDYAFRNRFGRAAEPVPRLRGVRENAMMVRRLVSGPGLFSHDRL